MSGQSKSAVSLWRRLYQIFLYVRRSMNQGEGRTIDTTDITTDGVAVTVCSTVTGSGVDGVICKSESK